MESYAYYNGKFGKKEEITIPLSDRSIYFGDAVYEVAVGCYDRILWEDEHIERLLRGAKRVGIEHGYTKATLSSLLREIAVKSLIKSYMIYLQISRGLPTRQHSANGCSANLLVTIEPLEIKKCESTMRLITYPDLRYGYCDIKTVNLLPAVLASTEAQGRGCDEAIFIKNDRVTEGAKSNISIIKRGRLITPPLSSNILPGITRAHLLSICKSIGIPLEESEITREELFGADEVLITSTTKLCRKAEKIDGLPIGGKNDEIYRILRESLYADYTKITKM